MDQNLEQFVDDLLQAKNLPSDLDSEVREQMKVDLYARVEQRLKAALVEAVPADQRDPLATLESSGASDQEVQAFMQSAVPNLEHVLSVALLEFKKSYLG